MIEVEGDITKALKHVGKRYDVLLFLWYGLRLGAKPWNDPDDMICSELIAEAVNDANLIGLTPNQQYDYLTHRTL